MRITFIMPFIGRPTGGLMVVYEYANQLVARGHEVTVVHARPLAARRPRLLSRLYQRLTGERMQPSNSVPMPQAPWYPIDSRVTMIYVPQPTASHVPDADALFINRWWFAGSDLPERKGKKLMLIQGYVAWPWLQAQEDALWQEPIPKIVIARWLYEKGLELGVPADEMIVIPNGIDHAKYRLLHPIENRPPRVAMLYHTMALKGAKDGIGALELARGKFPTLQAVLFGTFPRPKGLPDWIEYQCDPPQEELVGRIYNGSSIYLCPSWREGWHLPPAEAMACGCAVVSTDIGGVRDYAEHGVTALLSPPKNPEALADNIVRLLEDDDLRIRLAKAGHERIQEFTWERSTDLLEQFIRDKIRRPGAEGKV